MHMKVFLEYDFPMNLFHIFPLRVVHAVEYIPNVPIVSVWWCILIKAYCALDISIESILCFSWHMVLSYIVVFKYIETNSKNNKNARWICTYWMKTFEHEVPFHAFISFFLERSIGVSFLLNVYVGIFRQCIKPWRCTNLNWYYLRLSSQDLKRTKLCTWKENMK